jgi:hypothetical protein
MAWKMQGGKSALGGILSKERIGGFKIAASNLRETSWQGAMHESIKTPQNEIPVPMTLLT